MAPHPCEARLAVELALGDATFRMGHFSDAYGRDLRETFVMFEREDREALLADLGRIRGFVLESETRDLPTAPHEKGGMPVLDPFGCELRRIGFSRRDRREEATDIESLPAALKQGEREGLMWKLYWHEVALVGWAMVSHRVVSDFASEFEWLGRISGDFCGGAEELLERSYVIGHSEPTCDTCQKLLDFLEARGVDRRQRVELATRLSEPNGLSTASNSADEPALELAQAIRRLRAQLVNGNLRFVASRINEWRGSLPFDKALGFGVVGLALGIDRFDPHRGNQLSTYAGWWVRAAVRRGTRHHRRAVRIPLHQANRSGPVLRQLRRTWRPGMGKTEALKIACQRAEVDFASAHRDVQATEATPNSSWWVVGAGVTCEEMLFEPVTDPASMLADPTAVGDCEREIAAAIGRLERRVKSTPTHQKNYDRDIDVLIRRLGLGRRQRVALTDVGDDYGVTRERIRQVQEKLLELLRRARQLESYDDILDRALGIRDV